ncbi:hypothetical protein ASPCADRAFT_11279 [Aspergillus carbonarius ITEM 5010]|uniref:Uncharacterized protein n=1 Tax=Aspergillus carbonarius (strain ITEM 5010) TaxID=602072 RepID=A0A1R3R5Q6_ASPC5|nr:hypothetical protein ASPCADRAFT_11279 [Aspergillus carbonarius ITEM 5010]
MGRLARTWTLFTTSGDDPPSSCGTKIQDEGSCPPFVQQGPHALLRWQILRVSSCLSSVSPKPD